MLPTFVIGLREGLEAALIVGIIAAFLGQQGRKDALRQVWIGTAAAVAICIGVAIALQVISSDLPQRQQEGLETVVGALAIGMVTYMIVFMRKHARSMKKDLQGAAASALAEGSSRALVVMAFLAVLREGFETAVFLLATFHASGDASTSWLGAVLGIVLQNAMLRRRDFRIVTTSGTVRPFELTKVPPLIGGQVKTFHPAVYAGILARRDVPEQLAELEANGIGLIDIVVVNVAPFAPAVGANLLGIDAAIEMIDVGGAALLGAAARNAAGVAAVANPAHYPRLVAELREHGLVSAELRAQLAAEAFGTVAAYHAEIAAYLNQISGNVFPPRLALVLEKVDDLRYGENPHQKAAFYRETTHRSGTLADATQIRGERPSFNNYLDLDTAYRIARDFTSPTVAIVKHTDPVGIASSDELVEALGHANLAVRTQICFMVGHAHQ